MINCERKTTGNSSWSTKRRASRPRSRSENRTTARGGKTIRPGHVGRDAGFRRRVEQVAQLAADGKADDVLVKFPELPYFLAEPREKGFDMPMTQALLAYLDPAPRDWVDNMNRPRVTFWHQLTTRPGQKDDAP